MRVGPSGTSGRCRDPHDSGGDDTLFGGPGNDTLSGGTGADRFVFSSLTDGHAEIDVILDYDKDEGDRIDLPGGTASIAGTALVGGVWELTLVGGDVVRIFGATDSAGNGILDDLILV